MTTRWFIIVLSHCNKAAVDEVQMAFRFKLFCYDKGNINLMPVRLNRKCKPIVSKIQNKFTKSNIKGLSISNNEISKSCAMTVSTVIRPPFVYFTSSKNLMGIDVRILHEIASSINLNLQIFAFSFSNYTNNKFDVHVGYYDEIIKLKLSKPFDFHEFIYVVSPGKRISSLEKLFQGFDGKIWILICLIILMAFMSTYAMNTQSLGIRKFIFGKDTQLKFMNVLGGLLGTSSHQLVSQRYFIRFLWIAFLFFGILMRTLHQATLFKLLQNDDSEKVVQSLDEAIEKDFPVYTHVMYKEFVNQSMRYEAVPN